MIENTFRPFLSVDYTYLHFNILFTNVKIADLQTRTVVARYTRIYIEEFFPGQLINTAKQRSERDAKLVLKFRYLKTLVIHPFAI